MRMKQISSRIKDLIQCAFFGHKEIQVKFSLKTTMSIMRGRFVISEIRTPGIFPKEGGSAYVWHTRLCWI